MKNLLLIAGLVLALGACKSKMDKAIAEGSDIRDRMCACADKACGEKVADEYRAWKAGNKSLKDEKPTKEQKVQSEEIIEAYRACAHKLKSDSEGSAGSAAPPTPPAGSAAPPAGSAAPSP